MVDTPARLNLKAPPWKAKWCWTRKHLTHPWHSFVYFRRVVDLPAKPVSAIVRVSADARYTLFVNGRRVHYGPARCFPDHQSFDTIDLSEYLRAGANSICAIAYQYGIPTFQSVFRDAAGFILDGVADCGSQQVELHTPGGWKCRDAKAWRKDVARLSIQTGFQEHFDADADPADWLSPTYAPKPDDGWVDPFVHGPVGCHPWIGMEARGVPLLAEKVHPFAAAVAQFTGENARGYKIAADVYHLLEQETPRKDKTALDASAMLRDDNEGSAIPVPPDGHFTMLVLDLGQIRTGHVSLDIAEAAGDEIIDLIYTETLTNAQLPAIAPSGEYSQVALADRYRCRPGAQRWEPFVPKGCRYVTLVFRNIVQPLKMRHICFRQIHATVQDLGSFECSDTGLNKIWQVARQTLVNCMFDAYVDCPSREQAQWWGDARIQFKVNSYCFGDVSLLERGIRQVAQSQAADGTLHPFPPSDSPIRLPDYMLTWIGTLWDHYFHTGRKDLLAECLPTLKRTLGFFAAHESTEALIGGFDGFWVFLDWQNLYKADHSAVLNLMYLQGLRWAAAICQVLGVEAEADGYDAKAAALATLLEKKLWDPKGKAWRDGYDAAANAPVEQVSQHANALAVILRLRPESRVQVGKDVLLKSSTAKRSKVLTASPFFYAYVLEAMIEAGLRTEAIDLVREKWSAMIEAGATTFWERWDGSGSKCHAWSAAPLYLLSQQVLGVMPVDIGWKQVRIAPVPGKLDFARGTVPTPLGLIRVEWEKVEEDQLAVRVELPPGIEAEFVDPLGETRTLSAGPQEFHT